MVSFSKSGVAFLAVTFFGCGVVLYYAFINASHSLDQSSGAVLKKGENGTSDILSVVTATPHSIPSSKTVSPSPTTATVPPTRTASAEKTAVKNNPKNVAVNEENSSNLLQFCVNNSTQPHCCTESRCESVRKSTLYSACCKNIPTQSPGMTGHHRAPFPIIPILITATPRSGTVFVCHLLRKLGIPTNNDSQSPTRVTRVMVSWVHVMKDTRYFMDANVYGSKFNYLWHQTRDPLKSLTSLAFTEPLNGTTYQSRMDLRYLNRHITLTPIQRVKDTIRMEARRKLPEEEVASRFLIYRGMEYYNAWHNFILKLNVPRFSLEDLTVYQNYTILNDVFKVLGRPPPSSAKVQALVADLRRRRTRQRRLRSEAASTTVLQEKNHTNSRTHRSTIEWEELCQVSQQLAEQFLQLSHQLGYYLDKEQAC